MPLPENTANKPGLEIPERLSILRYITVVTPAKYLNVFLFL